MWARKSCIHEQADVIKVPRVQPRDRFIFAMHPETANMSTSCAFFNLQCGLIGVSMDTRGVCRPSTVVASSVQLKISEIDLQQSTFGEKDVSAVFRLIFR
jgi:hypothetical protein